jgi:8-oxo-dGTP pyrophosphatase MutT (NUDIX family)
VRVDRPPPREELNVGEEIPARPAASVIVLRDAHGAVEVLLVQRNPDARFMGGAWVFPGGAVGEEDRDHSETAVRELREEAGIDLPGAEVLVPFSRWVTPAEVKTRFDTWFFLTEAPKGASPRPDGAECVDARWFKPRDALAAHARDELMLVFPTIKHLEQLAELRSVAEALESARARRVVPIQPRVVVRDGSARVVLPGEPGYDE